MRLNVEKKKLGKLWTVEALEVARAKTVVALAGAAKELESAIRAAAPRATGELAASVTTYTSPSGLYVKVVEGTATRTAKGFSYGVPVQAGAKQSKVRASESLVRWVEIKKGLRGSAARSAAFAIARWKEKQGKTAGNPWFYGPFDRLLPSLNSNYLGPIGAAIVTELDELF